MTTELTVREPGAITPAEVVSIASEQARLLMSIVDQTKCFQLISGKKYLQVEAWETIGAFNRTHAETESITPIIRDNETIGYQAHVQLWKDGVVVGGAIMPCYFTENACKGKEGDAKHKASMSAAQTFATSKAYRMNFSYIAILAGYEPLPAEEITEDMKQPESSKEEHFCKLHGVNFFKKGKMKSYAHPIGDSGKWCHEHTEDKTAEPVPDVEQPEASQPEAKAEPVPSTKPKRDPATIKDFGHLYTACKEDWGMTREAVWKELGVNSQTDLSDTAGECYLKIVAVRLEP